MNSEISIEGFFEMLFDEILERVQEVTGWRTQTDLAEGLGIKQASVAGAKQRGVFPLEWAFKIARSYNVSTDWILTGEVPAFMGEDYIYIPLLTVRASAGGGAEVWAERAVDEIVFKADYIRNTLRVSPSSLYLIFVDGESMEPTLRPGDLILVDRSATIRDGIYVLRMDDGLLVKRLQRLPGNQVKISSDNPAYDPFVIDLNTGIEGIDIIGRVVWSGRRM